MSLVTHRVTLIRTKFSNLTTRFSGYKNPIVLLGQRSPSDESLSKLLFRVKINDFPRCLHSKHFHLCVATGNRLATFRPDKTSEFTDESSVSPSLSRTRPYNFDRCFVTKFESLVSTVGSVATKFSCTDRSQPMLSGFSVCTPVNGYEY